MNRIAFAGVFLLALALPVSAQQSQEQVEAWIGQLKEPDYAVRQKAVDALVAVGEPVVPRLILALDDPHWHIRSNAARTLGIMGTKAEVAMPALVQQALHDPKVGRAFAREALGRIGLEQKAAGGVAPWWLILHVYWRECACLLLGLTVWFVLARRAPRHSPAEKKMRVIQILVVFAVPTCVTCLAVSAVLSELWVKDLLPDLPLIRVPLPLASFLSAATVCGLGTVWAVQRKPADAPEPQSGASGSTLEPS